MDAFQVVDLRTAAVGVSSAVDASAVAVCPKTVAYASTSVEAQVEQEAYVMVVGYCWIDDGRIWKTSLSVLLMVMC